MINVPMSEQEIEVVRFIIDRYRKALLFEIANTDSRELRAHLKEREALLEAVVERLSALLPEGVGSES